MIRVKITDTQHPYCGETGVLRSSRKVRGRILEVFMDDYNWPTEVSKTQIEVLKSEPAYV